MSSYPTEIEDDSRSWLANGWKGEKQWQADLTSYRCARSCRSGRRGGRAPSGGCHSPGSPRTPASSWPPASRRRTNPPNRTLQTNRIGSRGAKRISPGAGMPPSNDGFDGELGNPRGGREQYLRRRRADERGMERGG